ncbi:hypothetical protein PbJCM13498_37010 [Prolixibacter bellariivorans]|uniref:Uncharacterized protein n=1 Tax=Prolixibacter bellariivorans TaxID=314319 RepID=A0A5M4B4R1_9BACT|nr:hypothetical protein PbJCM13498_37010 [Prolixibacter bellariivorans]
MTKHLTVLVPEFLVNTSSFPQEIAQYGNQFKSEGFEGPPSDHVYGGKNNPVTFESTIEAIEYVVFNSLTRLMNSTTSLIKKLIS